MPKYLVTKKMQYTEEVEVEAESKEMAVELAMPIDGTRIHDDHLYDCYAKIIEGKR
ncbi:hypothetical protein [Undibacterium oligocarboniphilum]|uniref:Uncharacterized protein n=1 Tax=Undibacterium oligocarboniphilum TaxID=666702 RepID=A0A850QH62_9BURK|nr:hypothetical protein [Undibacterium oligocarboniphilum]MBC3871503.1 hypothetical protein [Undibacterium oligocarboniphilum]NVO78921.1 hypothetical protein [Undibacterium oligocarboniphilum]